MKSQNNSQNKFWEKLAPVKPELYLGASLATLAAVGVFCLSEAGLEGSFDNVAVVLFRLFPEKFKLLSFPEYPDFLRIDNTLRLDCKHSHLVTGNRVRDFALTSHGRVVAEEALIQLRTGKSILTAQEQRQTLSGSRRNRETRLVDEVRKSEAYRKYILGKKAELNRYDVCDVLHGTLDTRPDKLKPNLELLKQYSHDLMGFQEYREMGTQVAQFLDFVESIWEEIFRAR